MSSAPTNPSPIPAQLVPPTHAGPIHVVIDQPKSRLGWLGRRFLWVVLGLSILMNFSLFGAYRSYYYDENNILEKYHSLSKTAEDKVAIISVEGAILGGEGYVKHQIDRVRDDEHVKAIVLRVDSPGGTVTGSDYIYHHLKQLAKERSIPLVVSMGSIAASGGYYVSMAAGDNDKTIYAEPTCWTGSIGVIIPHYDVSGLLEKWNVADDSIASGPLKQMGSPTRQLSPEARIEERAVLKELVDTSFAGFKELVLSNRHKLRENEKAQEAVFTGRIFTAKQAQENGLIDELGFIEDAIDRAVTLAGLNKADVRVVKYKKLGGMFDSLLSESPLRQRTSFDLGAVLDLTAPRAYYLCTWLPGLNLSKKSD